MPTALITGAGRGLGKELARQYAADGWKVIGTQRRDMDMADRRTIRAYAAKVKQPIDLLFCNAGITGRKGNAPGSFDFDTWEEILRVNLLGAAAVAETLLDNVAASERRVIAMMSSRLGSISVGCGRDDAVDHRAREPHGPIDPRFCRGSFSSGQQVAEVGHQSRERAAVAGQVVATDDSDRPDTRVLPLLQATHQLADDRLRRPSFGVRLHLGVIDAQPTRCRVVPVSLLGDGQSDDASGRRGKPSDELVRLCLGEEHFANRHQHAYRRHIAALQHAVEAVLRRQLLDNVTGALCHAADSP